MAFTKVRGRGVTTTDNYTVGVITATKFVGPITGNGGGIQVGLLTATGLDVNGDADISGNLTVGGDFTTLNTTLREVELLHVDANSSATAGIITQRGSGDILNLFDTSTEVLTVKDGGNFGIGTNNPLTKFVVSNAGAEGLEVSHASGTVEANTYNRSGSARSPFEITAQTFKLSTGNPGLSVGLCQDASGHISIGSNNVTDVNYLTINGSGASNNIGIVFNKTNSPARAHGIQVANTTGDLVFYDYTASEERLRITSAGKIGIGITNPAGNLHLDGGSNDPYIYIQRSGAGDSAVTLGGIFFKNSTNSLGLIDVKSTDINDGYMKFHTMGNGTLSERLRIGTDGTVTKYIDNGTTAQAVFPGAGQVNGITALPSLVGTPFVVGKDTGSGRSATFAGKVETGSIIANGTVGINTTAPQSDLQIITDGQDQDGTLRIGGSVPELGLVIDYDQSGATTARIYANANYDSNTSVLKICSDLDDNPNQLVLAGSGKIGIGSAVPAEKLDVAGHLKLATVQGTNTAANLPVLYQHNDNVIHGGSTLNWNPAEDVLKVNGSLLSSSYLYGSAGTLKLATANHSSTVYVEVTDKVEIAGQIVATQDYPNYRPRIDWNFAKTKKLDPRITFSRLGPASYVDKNGYVKLVDENEPRFDHDPLTGECKGLLMEQNVVNWIKWSSKLDIEGQWYQNGTTNVLAPDVVGPDGKTGNVYEVFENATNGYHATYYASSIPVNNGTKYSVSSWIKKGPNYRTDQASGKFELYTRRSGSGAYASIKINSAFTAIDTINNVDSSFIEQYRNGWVRVGYTFTADGTSGNIIPHWLHAQGQSYMGNAASSVYIWGCQFESMPFVTSYIPSAGDYNYRNDDIAVIDGTEFSEFFNPDEGTAVVHTHMPNSNGNSGLPAYTFKNSAVSAVTLGLSRDNNASPAYHYYNDGTNNGFTRASANNQNMYKGAMSFKTSDFDSYVNGSANTNTTTFTMPTIDNLRIGGTGGANQVGGHVARFMYYPVKLPNSQLITLTS